MVIKFGQLPQAIQRHYLSQRQILRIEVHNPAGHAAETYHIYFKNGTTRKWVYKSVRGMSKHWVMS